VAGVHVVGGERGGGGREGEVAAGVVRVEVEEGRGLGADEVVGGRGAAAGVG
jgi:hypothetical protein